MNPLLFLVALGTALAAHSLGTRWLGRRDRALALRRLAAKGMGRLETRRSAGPLLIAAANEMRGRASARVLEKLRLKQAAERLLETAALKWGAAGLLQRSIALFLAGFAGVTLATFGK